MANTTNTGKTELDVTQIVRTRLFPDEDALSRSAVHALFHRNQS